MPTYGQRPQDVIQDSRGNALRGVTVSFYATEELAQAGGTADGTAVTDESGRWRYTAAEGDLWARLPNETVWQIARADPASELAAHELETTSVHGIADTSALVTTDDPRLSDDRDPNAHTHGVADLTATGTKDTTTFLRGDNTWAVPPGGGGGGAVDSVNGQTGVVVLDAADVGAAATAHTHAATDVSDSTATGRSVLTAANAGAARTAIGAGTSSFSGAYADLSGKPTLGTAAATASTDYATAAQGTTADSALQVATAQPINAQTGTSYTLVAGDAGKVVTLSNTGAITLNAPGSVFTAGQRVDVVVINTGMATVVGTSGATASPPADRSLVSRVQYSAFTILWTSATACVVIGDLA